MGNVMPHNCKMLCLRCYISLLMMPFLYIYSRIIFYAKLTRPFFIYLIFERCIVNNPVSSYMYVNYTN